MNTKHNTIRKDISLNVLGNFTDHLLKNAVRSSEYIRSNGCILSGTRIAKDVAGRPNLRNNSETCKEGLSKSMKTLKFVSVSSNNKTGNLHYTR